jgi:hypothetical protein
MKHSAVERNLKKTSGMTKQGSGLVILYTTLLLRNMALTAPYMHTSQRWFLENARGGRVLQSTQTLYQDTSKARQ